MSPRYRPGLSEGEIAALQAREYGERGPSPLRLADPYELEEGTGSRAPLVGAAAGGVGGLLIGGPVGGLIGAVIGWFGGRRVGGGV